MNIDQDAYNANTQPMLSHINIGTGVDCFILDLFNTIATVAGYRGKIISDTSKSDGAPRKLMDVARLTKLGWNAETDLEEGLKMTYKWFLDN